MRHLVLVFALAAAACRPADRPGDANAPATRVVSLLPSFTEILFAIGAGDRLVGRTTWCDYPPEAGSVPSVGDGIPPNVEAVAARRPDLVVLYKSGANVAAAEQLERLGIRTVLLDLDLLEHLGPATRRLGALTGREAAGDSLARALDSLASVVPQAPAPGPQSLVFIVWDNPPIVIGAGSYLDRIAALAGGRNVFHDLAAPSAQVSIESIAARDPDFVAILSETRAVPDWASRREWRAVRAVRERRFLHLNGSLFGRPGPRAAEAVGELRRLLEAAR